MGQIYRSASEMIGNTPLLEVTNVERKLGLEARVLVKLEYFNPAGSVKDRVAKSMIEDAEQKGILKKGSVIFREYRNRAGVHCSFQGIPPDSDHAGDHERGTQKYIEGIRSGAGADGRRKGHERSDCKG